jgi:HSP20 family protein
MAVIFPDPFGSLLEFQEALDALRASSWLGSGPSGSGSYPPINVFQNGDDFVLVAELPGVKKSELDIQVKDNTVRIAGAKAIGYPEKAALHRRERLAGRFDRAITLPVQIDTEKAKAEYRSGLLALFLPRAERDKPRTVKVN